MSISSRIKDNQSLIIKTILSIVLVIGAISFIKAVVSREDSTGNLTPKQVVVVEVIKDTELTKDTKQITLTPTEKEELESVEANAPTVEQVRADIHAEKKASIEMKAIKNKAKIKAKIEAEFHKDVE